MQYYDRTFNGFIYIPVVKTLKQLVMVGCRWLYQSLSLLLALHDSTRDTIRLETVCVCVFVGVQILNENDGKEHIFQTMINWLFWQIAIVHCIDPFIIAMMRAFDAEKFAFPNLKINGENLSISSDERHETKHKLTKLTPNKSEYAIKPAAMFYNWIKVICRHVKISWHYPKYHFFYYMRAVRSLNDWRNLRSSFHCYKLIKYLICVHPLRRSQATTVHLYNDMGNDNCDSIIPCTEFVVRMYDPLLSQ